MHTPGLTNAPITKFLLLYTLTSSILLSILDSKHLASIHVSPHLWTYGQFWRCLIWQIAGFANSTEALFAALLIYHCRVVERAWGSRKVVTFILSTLPYTTLLPPFILACLLRPLSANKLNYLPSGPTGVIFALLAQYYVTIPSTFRLRFGTSSPSSSSPKPSSTSSSSQPTDSTTTPSAPSSSPDTPNLILNLTSKSTTYLVALQLALSQFPYTLLPAAIGWFVGLAWRAEVLPGLGGTRRVPAWVVGEREVRRVIRNGEGEAERRYEDLRRRLEGEVVAVSGSSGAGGNEGQEGSRQRRGGIVERLRGVF